MKLMNDELLNHLGDRFCRLQIRRWTGCRFKDYIEAPGREEARAQETRAAVRKTKEKTMPRPAEVPIEDQIRCVRREIALREACYPRWVARSRISAATANREIEQMTAVLRTLESLTPLPGSATRSPRGAVPYPQGAVEPEPSEQPGWGRAT